MLTSLLLVLCKNFHYWVWADLTFVTEMCVLGKFIISVVCLIDDFQFGVLEWLCDACGLFRCVCEAGPIPAHITYDFRRP